jgi:hypothetical protein
VCRFATRGRAGTRWQGRGRGRGWGPDKGGDGDGHEQGDGAEIGTTSRIAERVRVRVRVPTNRHVLVGSQHCGAEWFPGADMKVWRTISEPLAPSSEFAALM